MGENILYACVKLRKNKMVEVKKEEIEIKGFLE